MCLHTLFFFLKQSVATCCFCIQHTLRWFHKAQTNNVLLTVGTMGMLVSEPEGDFQWRDCV